jgi:hypothetical protein
MPRRWLRVLSGVLTDVADTYVPLASVHGATLE